MSYLKISKDVQSCIQCLLSACEVPVSVPGAGVQPQLRQRGVTPLRANILL